MKNDDRQERDVSERDAAPPLTEPAAEATPKRPRSALPDEQGDETRSRPADPLDDDDVEELDLTFPIDGSADMAVQGAPPRIFYDDDDDIDDFDDLGDLEGVEPFETRRIEDHALSEQEAIQLPKPDAFDFGGTAALAGEPADDAPVEPDGTDAGPGWPDAEAPVEPDPDPDIPPIAFRRGADEPKSRHAVVEPEPELDSGPDEAEIASLDTALALQPIPELQSAAGSGRADQAGSSTTRPIEDDEDDEVANLLASVSEPDEFDSLPEDVAELGLDDSDASSRPPNDDWHAHLAELIAAEDQEEQSDSETVELTDAADDEDDGPIPLLALSPARPENELLDDDDAEPIPPRLTARRPDDGPRTDAVFAELTQEQFATAAIANVPRLRRFAAALIGDEEAADWLVRDTIKTAFSNPAAMKTGADTGLELLGLLYRRRQGASARSENAARVFETSLCRKLVGADQFEMHEFAQAINSLDERLRAPLLLVALENLSYRDVASVLDVPESAIMDVMAESRVHLRQTLGTYDPCAIASVPSTDGMHARENEIHGYLDGELDDRHMAEVDALVERDEDAADRLLQYGIQGDLIRRLYAPVLNRPIPYAMLEWITSAARPPARLGFRFGRRRALMAGAILLALGGAAAAWPYLAPFIGTIVPEAMAISSKFAIG